MPRYDIPKGATPVCVVWDDSWCSLETLTAKAAVAALRYTLGWLYRKDDEHVVVAWTADVEGPVTIELSYDCPWRFPRGMVKCIIPLQPIPAKPRKRKPKPAVPIAMPIDLPDKKVISPRPEDYQASEDAFRRRLIADIEGAPLWTDPA